MTRSTSRARMVFADRQLSIRAPSLIKAPASVIWAADSRCLISVQMANAVQQRKIVKVKNSFAPLPQTNLTSAKI